MEQGNWSRRGFMQRSLAALAAAGFPAWYAQELFAEEAKAAEAKQPAANERIVMALIGCGGQGRHDMKALVGARGFGVACVAVCDVDQKHRDETAQEYRQGGKECKPYEDYRAVLDRPDVQAVSIGTPDHWHTRIAIDALRQGKDVYCQKPLTLTIAEGQALVKVAQDTGRIFQVGSQQRSGSQFRLACELVRNGRIGKVQTVETRIGGAPKGGPFKKSPVPEGLNWDMWLGQAPQVDYLKERCHGSFRWWYEYSGGKMTDWGAHHNDIAQWGLGMDHSGPHRVEGTGTADTRPDCYNVHQDFTVRYRYANGTELVCTSAGENGIKFIGEDGKWIFVSRGKIEASDKALLAEKLPADAKRLYVSNNHYANFLECTRTRKPTICPAEIGHRSVTVCHLGTIALRSGKKLDWDPVKERFADEEANQWLSRPMRAPWGLKA